MADKLNRGEKLTQFGTLRRKDVKLGSAGLIAKDVSVVGGGPSADGALLETGDNVLLESGDFVLLE